MPSKSLGTLTLDLIAKIGGFTGPLDKAGRHTKKTSNDISNDLKKIGAGLAAVGATAVASTAVLIKSQINAADELTKTSQAVGFQVDELSGLEYAAKLNGVEFGSLTSGLNKFNKSIFDATVGTGLGAETFGMLGIEVKKADGTLKTNSQLLDEVADKFSAMEDGALKSAAAQDLLGRSGAQLIPFLNQGSAGIEQLTDEAERLGLVIDKDTGRAAEQFNDNLTRLRSVVTGTGRELTAELLPSMVEFTDLIADPETQKSIKAIVTGVADIAIGAVEAANAIVFLGGEIKAITTGIKPDDIVRLEDDAEKIRDILDGGFFNQTERVRFFGPDGIIAFETTAELEAKLKELEGAIEAYYNKPDNQPKVQIDFGTIEALPARAATLEDLPLQTLYVEDLTGAYEDFQRVIESLRTPQEIYNEKIADAILLAETGAVSWDDYSKAVSKYAEDLLDAADKSGQATDDIKNVLGDLEQYAERAASAMEAAFGDFFFDPIDKGIKGLVRDVGNAMRRIAADIAAAELTKAIGTGLSSSSNPYVAAIGAAFGGARAEGGPTQPGKAYLVGENGPEMWVPNAYGAVISNDNLKQGRSETLVKTPIVAIGDDAVANAMASSAGEQVILTHVRNNWGSLSRGG